ncbi:MAG TPA: transcriptional repressor [Acidimicrobiales bacterium]|nr:transcriptional repressor [Acidimicrobiales bacterium]
MAECRCIPQSTACRNLAVLGQAGVVRRVVGSDDFIRYELAEEVTGRHHHHLVCRLCGAVEDFAVSPKLERSVDALMNEIGSNRGFRAEAHRLDVLGTCATCTS